MAELSPARRHLAARDRASAPLRLPDERADLIMLLVAIGFLMIAAVGAWRGWW